MTRLLRMPWLPPAPENVRTRIAALNASDTPDESEVRQLAALSLDVVQLRQLSGVVAKHGAHLVRHCGFSALRLGIVGSHSQEFLALSLPAAGLRYGLVIDVLAGGYAQAAQELLEPASPFARHRLDAVMISADYRALGLDRWHLHAEDAETAVQAALHNISLLASGVRTNVKATYILQTIVPPDWPIFGNHDGRVDGTPRAMIQRCNQRLRAEVMTAGDLLVDVADLAAQVGLDQWLPSSDWHAAKLPASLEATPLYADHVCRVLGAARGKSRKCLVTDLDNTLWGGVIGDDGVSGLVLGRNTSTGEAHLALQAYLLELRRRGVILAVCSKNDDHIARLPFREHSEMLLKEADFAVFAANWSAKAHNLRQIAAALNISTDALVLLDDDPGERQQVRALLPDVAVPELTGNAADYVTVLANAGYFEAASVSEEDIRRADLYSQQQERAAVLAGGTVGEYLDWLQMKVEIQGFTASSRTRITQLINKSNQFNLTTRRYSEAEIAAFERSSAKHCLQIRLWDRFGDNGIVSTVIHDKGPEEWVCDLWVMSCRVIGRRVEEHVLQAVVEAARREGAHRLTGVFSPTKKNGLVAEHFKRLGYANAGERADGHTMWTLDLRDYKAPDIPIERVQSVS